MIDHYYDCFRDVTSKNWDLTQKSDQKAKATQKWWRKTGNVGNWPGLRLTILSHNLGVPGHRGSKELVILTHCTSTWWYIAWCTYSIEVEREEKMREIMSTVEYACMCIVYIYMFTLYVAGFHSYLRPLSPGKWTYQPVTISQFCWSSAHMLDF